MGAEKIKSAGAGHNAGMLAMKEIIKRADVLGIKYLTVYAFSTENWKRSQEEVGGIFGLLVKYVASELKELNENNVKVAVLGDLKKDPEIGADQYRQGPLNHERKRRPPL